MTFENSDYYSKLKPKKIALDVGNFYFSDKFIIAELEQGIHFDWELAESLIPFAIEHYGENVKVAYISNRINSYSYDPHVWSKFEEKYNFVVASAVVTYYDRAKQNATLDKHFSKKSIKRCMNVDKAIEWVLNLKEFNSTEVA